MAKRLPTYIDGLVSVYETVTTQNAFGGTVQSKTLVFANCPFGEMSCRQQDTEFAEQNNFSISRKIKVRYCDLIKRNKKYKAIIDDELYDVSYFDKGATDTFLYLEFVKKVTA